MLHEYRIFVEADQIPRYHILMNYIQVLTSVTFGQQEWRTINSKDVRRLTGIADEPDGKTTLSSYQANIAVEELRKLDRSVSFQVVDLIDAGPLEEFIFWSPSPLT